MRKLPANVHKRLAAIENRSVIDKPYMLVPKPMSVEAWGTVAELAQHRLKNSVVNGDIAPDYNDVEFGILVPTS